MVVDRKPTTESIGRVVADAVRGDDAVRELWVTQDSEGFIISLLTQKVDFDHERKLYGVSLEVRRRFPEVLFETHVNVATRYPTLDFDHFRTSVVPGDAVKIPIRR